MKPVIQVVSARAELEAIVPAWEDLAANAAEANPFYEPWVLLPALEAQGEGDGFRCILMWHDHRLVGLFPFKRERNYKGLPVNALVSWRHSSYLLCTPLVRAGLERDCLRALIDWAKIDASALEFRYIATDGPFNAALEMAPAMVTPVAKFTRALLRKGPSAEAYIESALSSQFRRQLRKQERRLAGKGTVRTFAIGPGEAIGEEIERFLALEASGWKGKAGGALAASESTLRFARALFSEAHRRGQLHMVGIDLDGRPVARRLSLLSGNGSYAFKTAYDEAFASHSPGVLAELLNLREFHHLPGVHWMDSYTDPDNTTVNRMWKDRRAMQHVAVGVGAWGEFWISTLPVLRYLRASISSARQSLSTSR